MSFENVDDDDGRRRTTVYPLSSLGASGSGELKQVDGVFEIQFACVFLCSPKGEHIMAALSV